MAIALLYSIEYICSMMNRYAAVMMLVAVGLGLGLEANAEEINTQQVPLIYEFNLKGPLTLESERMTVQGTIKTISASWDFEGEVRLEVSANAGSSYAKIINGQILNEGFIPGNQLCFRANVPEGSVIKSVTLGYEDTSGASRFLRSKELAAFKYNKAINISGSSEELFNYPLKIRIGKDVKCEGDVEPDFRDIRFAAADGQTLLNYYLEPSSIFWVKIPQIPEEGVTIYMYYGNKEAVTLSNPERVFPFFDDFNSKELNQAKWQVRQELEKTCGLKDGRLQLKGGSVIARNFKMKKGVLEFKAKAEKNAAIQAICRGVFTGRSVYPSEQMVYSSAYPGAEHTIAVNDVAKLNIGNPIQPYTDYIYKAIVGSAGITFERYSGDYEKQAEIRFLDTYTSDEGYIGLKAGVSFFDSGNVYFDWVRARPYAEVEPKAVEK